jgi:CheY-like chemotaxis protein
MSRVPTLPKVLVVDDSSTIRLMLKRVLVNDLHCDVVEAANGIEALEQIALHRPLLTVLDFDMPLMDGLETLQAIRGVPAWARLNVVMLTAQKNEEDVRRLIELGISDYLSKPLSQQQMSDRLAKVLTSLRHDVPGPGLAPAGAGSSLDGQRVLVVDEDLDVRHFIVDVMHSRFEMEEAESAPHALKRCLDEKQPPPRIVFVGSEIGPMPAEMFVARLRKMPHLKGVRLIAVVPKSDVERVRASGLYQAVLPRTFVPEAFLHKCQQALDGVESPLARFLLLRPGLRRDAIAAAEQVFGMMLATDVTLCSEETATMGSGSGAHAAIDLTAEGDDPSLTLMLRSDPASARTFTARMLCMDASSVQDDDVLPSAGEIINIMVGRLRTRFTNAGINVRMGLPRTWIGETPARKGPDEHADDIDMMFQSAPPAFTFWIRLSGWIRTAGSA